MSLTSSRMRAVNAVFDAGSFSQAARRLGLSQPAITQQVRGLENHFGVTLFERRGSKLTPTALCREFVAVTSQLHGIEAQALAVLRQNDALKGGELRIGLGNAMPGMALISAFHRLYPNIQIAVEMGNWASIIDAVVDQRVDVGVLPDVPSDSRFHREVCVRQGVVAIVHPNHPLARVKRISCADLAKHRLVFRTKQSSTQRVVDRGFSRCWRKAQAGDRARHPRRRIRSGRQRARRWLHVGIRIKPRRQDRQNSRARNGDTNA
jgi:LysR family transcriptional regulator, low CO2-responsive transcriptional regulator